jgi:hypothetical protein
MEKKSSLGIEETQENVSNWRDSMELSIDPLSRHPHAQTPKIVIA